MWQISQYMYQSYYYNTQNDNHHSPKLSLVAMSTSPDGMYRLFRRTRLPAIQVKSCVTELKYQYLCLTYWPSFLHTFSPFLTCFNFPSNMAANFKLVWNFQTQRMHTTVYDNLTTGYKISHRFRLLMLDSIGKWWQINVRFHTNSQGHTNEFLNSMAIHSNQQ